MWALLVAALSLQASSSPPRWDVSASVYTYIVPDDSNYAQPTVTADRGRLHLEGRFNYEARDAGSLWAGRNFDGGDDSWWSLTPMVGVVFGDTSGIAPGYRGSISWRRLELYSESEYVFDTTSSSDSFLYNWSELTVSPVDWLRAGVAVQRTRAYQTERDLQRGLVIGVTHGRLEVSTTVFDLAESKRTVVVMIAAHF